MPSEKPSTTEQTSNELNLFIDQGDAVIRGLAKCALDSDSDSDMRAAASAAGKLAESIEYVRQLGEAERRVIVGHLGVAGVEAAAAPSEVTVDQVTMSDMTEILPGIKLSRPASVVIGTLVNHPGQWFTPIELRQRVGDLASTDSARSQAVVKALQRVRYSPYATQLDTDGQTRTRRYRWVPADASYDASSQDVSSVSTDDSTEVLRQRSDAEPPVSAEGRSALATPTPRDVRRSFTQAVRPEAASVQTEAASLGVVEREVAQVFDQGPDTQELVGIDKDIQTVAERFAGMFSVDRRADGGLMLHQNNIPVKASQQVIELLVKVAAVDPGQGYAIADLVSHFCPAEPGAGKEVRREHVGGKRVLFMAINSELPKLIQQLSPDLELKVEKSPYQARSGGIASWKQSPVTRVEKSLAVVRNDMTPAR